MACSTVSGLQGLILPDINPLQRRGWVSTISIRTATPKGEPLFSLVPWVHISLPTTIVVTDHPHLSGKYGYVIHIKRGMQEV